MKRSLCRALCLLSFLPAAAQSASCPIDLATGLHLPKDTVAGTMLLQSLSGFLAQKEQANAHNSYVWMPELAATSVLLDEMKGIEQDRELKKNYCYKPRLDNIVLLADSSYLLQLSYAAIERERPVQKASFRLMARRERDRFCFFAPLKRNSKGWKTLQCGHMTFYYKDTINKDKAIQYQQYNDAYLARLGNSDNRTCFYCCEDLPEGLQLIGVDYQKDYNAHSRGSMSSTQHDTTIVLNGSFTPGFLHFDPHDLWHDKLRTVLSDDVINRPVDEGCAYLYGGSWGYSWDEIKAMFREYHQQHPDADWLGLYVAGTRFREGDKYMLISYFLNALLVQRLEKEKGFAAVMTLLSCGKKEKDDANYFNALEQTAGITRDGFNAHINMLLKEI